MNWLIFYIYNIIVKNIFFNIFYIVIIQYILSLTKDLNYNYDNKNIS